MTASNLACFPEDAIRLCKLSGAEISLKRSQLMTLRDCEETLKHSVREVQTALDSYSFFRKAELAARIILVTCDVVVMVLEDKAGPTGMVVSKVYDGGKLMVDAVNGNIDRKTGVMMLIDNKATIAALSAQHMGADKAAKAIDAAANLVSLADTLWDQVTGGMAGMDGASGIRPARKSVQNQLGKVQRQIALIEDDLQNC